MPRDIPSATALTTGASVRGLNVDAGTTTETLATISRSEPKIGAATEAVPADDSSRESA